MSLYPISINRQTAAINAFQSVQREAELARLIKTLLHRDQALEDFSDLPGVEAEERLYKGLQIIPLKEITGSVNRKGDFDRKFRPLQTHLRGRWVNMYLLNRTDGWPPVRLYKAGETYYVADGHHRISVANAMGMEFIEAVVWEYVTNKPPSQCKSVRIPARLSSLPSYCGECG